MSDPKIILAFSAGDPVPEWLIGLEKRSGPGNATLTFREAGCVVELNSRYLLCIDEPKGDLPFTYRARRGDGGKFSFELGATSKTTIVPTSFTVFVGPDDPRPDRGETYTNREDDDE